MESEIFDHSLPVTNVSTNLDHTFKLIADTAPVMIWMAGTDKGCYYFNKSWLDFRDRTLEEECGEGWLAGVHPEDYADCVEQYHKHFDERRPFELIYRLVNGEGEYRWIKDQGVPRFSEQGTFEGYIGSRMDVHEHKMQEDLLEGKIAIRTTELQEAVSKLELSNQSLEQFTYAASHDLKEPLRKILIYSEILSSKPEHSAKLIPDIQRSARRMMALIDNLLSFSRLGHEAQHLTEVDLSEVINDVLDDLNMTLQEKNGRVLKGVLPCVNADEEQLRIVFRNILSNALKYAKPDVPPLIEISSDHFRNGAEISMGDLSPGSEYVCVSIKDNGIGFEQEHAERIFKLFERLHGKGDIEGSGLGLSIAMKAVQMSGGYMTAVSSPGEGSTFHVYLPA